MGREEQPDFPKEREESKKGNKKLLYYFIFINYKLIINYQNKK